MLRETPVDAVVTDLRMPDVDGLEIMRRAPPRARRRQVIVITAFGDDGVGDPRDAQGAADYVTKPFESRSSC